MDIKVMLQKAGKKLESVWTEFTGRDLKQVIINPDGHTAVVGFSYRKTLRLIEAAENARWLNEVRRLKSEVGDDTAEPGKPTTDTETLPAL
jgi:hypothetical protein